MATVHVRTQGAVVHKVSERLVVTLKEENRLADALAGEALQGQVTGDR